MTRKSAHDCPCCTCGKIELTWSDRSRWVYPDDYEAIADVVVSCALDHAYDRGSGVPHGLRGALREALEQVVAKHLCVKDLTWRGRTVDMDEQERKAFRDDLLAELQR